MAVKSKLRPVFRQPTEADIVHLAAHMRQDDINDLRVVGWEDNAEAIRLSIARSDPRYLSVVEVDGELLCIFGCATESLLSPVGIPWLLCTDAMTRYIKEATVKTRLVVRYMLNGWPVLQNVVDARNKMTIRWLKSIGFAMGTPYYYHTGFLVVPFEMRKSI